MKIKTDIIHLGLCKLFNDILLFEESGFAPICILHRIMREGNIGRTSTYGHKILCNDISPEQRRLWTAVRNLGVEYQIIVVTKHMPVPLQRDGKPTYKKWGVREMGQYLNEKRFKYKYELALKEIRKHM